MNSRTGNIAITTNDLYFGYQDGVDYMNGIMDELRISSISRSADWIKAEYVNQNTPTSYITFNPPPTLWTWQGDDAVNPTYWSDVDNWDQGTVPDNTRQVLIPNTANKPQLTANSSAKRLTINSGASVDLNNYSLTIADSDGLENQGSIYYSTGSSSDISLTDTDSGTAVYNVTRDIRDYGAEDYYNLTIDGAAVTVTLTADLKVNGDLSFLNGGTLNLNGYTLTVEGDVTGTGTLNVVDGTLIVNGDLTVSTLTATSGTIQVGGIFNTSFTADTSTVEFIDSGKPSKIFNANTFNNLNIITPGKRVIIGALCLCKGQCCRFQYRCDQQHRWGKQQRKLDIQPGWTTRPFCDYYCQ
jgi:hypothetical protein